MLAWLCAAPRSFIELPLAESDARCAELYKQALACFGGSAASRTWAQLPHVFRALTSKARSEHKARKVASH